MGLIKKVFSSLLPLTVMLASFLVAEDSCLDCCELSGCQFAYLGHTEGRWLDNREGYTTFGAFSQWPALGFNNLLTFVDVRAHVFNNGKRAANIGIGARYVTCNNQVFGANVFYDFREAYWHHRFNQIGVGLEMLTPCWEARLNGYFPIGRRWGHSSTHHFDFSGSFSATCREKRVAMGGADFEIGRWLNCGCFSFYAGIGPYFYLPEEHRNVYGGEIRLLANIGRYVTLEARAGYDRVFHGEGQGTIIVSIPFELFFGGKGGDTCQQGCCVRDIACQRVERQEIIAISHKDCCWTWNWDDSCSSCNRSRY